MSLTSSSRLAELKAYLVNKKNTEFFTNKKKLGKKLPPELNLLEHFSLETYRGGEKRKF
jgi:hypothetical protein